MPHEPITQDKQVLSESGQHDLLVLEKYEAPAGPDGEIANDPYKKMDLANARWMYEVLSKAYPGVPWRCIYDGFQKMAYLSIPILMGVNKFWAINLVTDELTDGLLKRAGGEILERYRISRGRFNLGQFLDAREKYSALVIPSRLVPE